MIFFGITSLNALDALVEINNPSIGLTISDNQVSHTGGYSGLKNDDLLKISLFKNRDHCICNKENLTKQVAFFDEIHLDVFKTQKINSNNEAIYLIEKYIDFCLSLNPELKFEIGTEESIFRYPEGFLNELVKIKAPNIKWVVVQGGEYVDCLSNKNNFDKKKLQEQCNLVHEYGFLTKAHNCDFLLLNELSIRKECGVDAFNFGPEVAFIENSINIKKISPEDQKLFLERIDRRWFKDCNPSDEQLLLGNLHYFYSSRNSEVKNQIKKFILERI